MKQWIKDFVEKGENNFWERYTFYHDFHNFFSQSHPEFKLDSKEAYFNQLEALNDFLSNPNISHNKKTEIILSPQHLHPIELMQVWSKFLKSEKLEFLNYLQILKDTQNNSDFKFLKHYWLNSEKVWNNLNVMLKSDPLLTKIDEEKISLLFRNSLYYILENDIFKTH